MRIIKKFLLLFLIFTLIFKPEFIFIPHSVNLFFGLLGIIFVLINKKKSKLIFMQARLKQHSLFLLLLPFVVVSFFSILINGSFDLYYPRYAISIILGFYSFYLVAVLFYHIYGKMSFQKLSDYFVLSECIFLTIALLSFTTPGLYEYLNSLQKFNEISQDAMDRTEGARLISIGAQFFSASIINGFSLMMIALNFLFCRMSNLKIILYFLAFIFITVVGMMMGRSTMIGAFIGFGLITYALIGGNRNNHKLLISFVSATFFLYLAYVCILSSYTSDYEELAEFGFETFINYNSGQGFHAHSNERLADMYNTIPDNLKTWIIGDAKWSEGDHYYKRVDTGYLRGLWYFGIVGLIALFYYYIKTIYYYIYQQKQFENKRYIVFLSFVVYTVVLNYKGPVDLILLLLPFMYCTKSEVVDR